MIRSLTARLILGLALSLAVVFACQWLAVRLAIHDMMEAFIAEELEEDAEELLAALDLTGQPGKSWVERIDPAFSPPHSGHYYEVLIDGVKAYASPSLVGHALGTTAVDLGAAAERRVSGPRGEELLAVSKGYQKEGRKLTIAIAIDVRLIEHDINRFLGRYTQLSIAMLLLLLLLQNLVVRHALSALGRVRAEVARMGTGQSERVSEDVPSEIAPLVAEINNLSTILAQRLKRSREALGNLAHALKTPLTLLTQYASDEQLAKRTQLSAPILEQLGIVRRRIDFELKRARLAGRGQRAHIDLCAELEGLAQAMRSLYRERSVQVNCLVRSSVNAHS